MLRGRLERAELWAVVKADGYGHGAVDVGRTALAAGATALGVATLGEALELRRALPTARIILLGPAGTAEIAAAREARLELCLSAETAPPDVPVHLKLDTGMGRWGLSELAAPGSGVVGPDEPLRDGGYGHGFHRAAARALPHRDRRRTRT